MGKLISIYNHDDYCYAKLSHTEYTDLKAIWHSEDEINEDVTNKDVDYYEDIPF